RRSARSCKRSSPRCCLLNNRTISNASKNCRKLTSGSNKVVLEGCARTSPLRARTLDRRERGGDTCRSRGVKRESFDPGAHGELAYGESFDGDHISLPPASLV